MSCSGCPPNAEPSDVPLACRCQQGYYNSSFGLVQCLPEPMPNPQDLFVCQPCGACLDCEASLSTFTRALVLPGFKLGVAASKAYQGVERGGLHVDKVFHTCAHSMCAGEHTTDSRGRDAVQVAIAVSSVDIAATDAQTEARANFTATFATAWRTSWLLVHLISRSNAVMVAGLAPSTGTLRRWLQETVAAGVNTVVSFTITIDADLTASLMARIDVLRNTTGSTIALSNGATSLTSTFTEPMVVPHGARTGIQCREGHDPTSPLCHVCLDGAVLQAFSAAAPHRCPQANVGNVTYRQAGWNQGTSRAPSAMRRAWHGSVLSP
jgi:hypothetical protein